MLKILFLIGCFTSLYSNIVKVPVTNLYLNPVDQSEVDSQVIFSEKVDVVDASNPGWLKILTKDGVSGWVLSDTICVDKQYENGLDLYPVKNLYAHIYRVDNTIPYPPLITIPFGSKVKVLSDQPQRWIPIELVGGEKAWIQRGDIDFAPKNKTLGEMIELSRKFLGLPYTWGGASSFGFDCSGFVQMLYLQMGIQLPRNSKDQAKSDLLIEVKKEDLQPGDLVFFGALRIGHVGMYLGNDRFIHSGVTEAPIIMVSDLSSGLYQFNCARRLNVLK